MQLRASCVQTLYKIRAKLNNPWQSYWRFRTLSLSSFRGSRMQNNCWRTRVRWKCGRDRERKNVSGLGIEFTPQSFISYWQPVRWRKWRSSWEQMPQSWSRMEWRSLVLYNGFSQEMGTVRHPTLSWWVYSSVYFVCRIHTAETTDITFCRFQMHDG